jgi:hypothetical protein
MVECITKRFGKAPKVQRYLNNNLGDLYEGEFKNGSKNGKGI